MLTQNTSLMLAGSDLRLLDESGDAPRATSERPSHRTLTALARLASRVMSLFL